MRRRRSRARCAVRGAEGALLLCVAALAPAQAQHEPATVELAVQDDPVARTLTVRLGPVSLPAGSHRTVAPPDFYLSAPFEGWLISYSPKITDAAGDDRPSELLHHVSLWNTERPDFLCPNKDEYVFGSGSEMTDWPALADLGYPVSAGDSLRIETRFHNPTDEDHLEAYLEVKIGYVRGDDVRIPLTNAYPAKFNVQGCAPSGYLLRAGESAKAYGFSMPVSGRLMGVGGHLHDYGRALWLQDVTRVREVVRLRPELHPDGRLHGMPIITFLEQGGYRLEAGDSVHVTADYRVSAERLPALAMGIMLGLFVPDDDRELAALKRSRGN